MEAVGTFECVQGFSSLLTRKGFTLGTLRHAEARNKRLADNQDGTAP